MVAFYQYFTVFFFQNDIITVSYVILPQCSKTFEIPCFEKKKEISRETAGLKQDFCLEKHSFEYCFALIPRLYECTRPLKIMIFIHLNAITFYANNILRKNTPACHSYHFYGHHVTSKRDSRTTENQVTSFIQSQHSIIIGRGII